MTDVAHCWRFYVRQHLPSTIKHHDTELFWGRLKWFSNLNPARLSSKEVEQYVASRGKATNATINRELNVLRACLRFAEAHGLIAKAPIIRGLKVPPTKVRSLTKDEAKALVRAADKKGNWRDQVYIRLALGSGARPGALCDLKWEQVDKEIIDFRRHDEKSERRKRRSIVPINPMVRVALDIAEANRRGNAYVLHWNGRKLATPRILVQRLARLAKIENVTPHVLRHTVASLLLQDGVDLLRVSRLLGHANSRITEQVYFQAPASWLTDTTKLLDF